MGVLMCGYADAWMCGLVLKMTGASIFKLTPLQIIKPKEYICTRQAEHY